MWIPVPLFSTVNTSLFIQQNSSCHFPYTFTAFNYTNNLVKLEGNFGDFEISAAEISDTYSCMTTSAPYYSHAHAEQQSISQFILMTCC